MIGINAFSEETIEQVKKALADSVIAKTTNTATGVTSDLGLVGINLEAPAKHTYPVLAPLGERFPRIGPAPMGSTSVQWRTITDINTAALEPGVAEGAVNTTLSYKEEDKSATYKSLNHYSVVTDEALYKGRGFNDNMAFAQLSALQNLQIGQELYIIGGNSTVTGVDFGVSAATCAPTLDVTATGGCTGTYYVRIIPLNTVGFWQTTWSTSNVATAIPTVYNKGLASTSTSTGSISSKKIKATWSAAPGAVAYAVFVSSGADTLAASYLQNVVTVNYWDSGTTDVTATGQVGSALTNADHSTMAVQFDGLIAQAFATGSGAYTKDLGNSTGTGALTADGSGNITQIDDAHLWFWNNKRTGPTLWLINAQESRNIANKIGGATAASLGFRINTSTGPDQKAMVAGTFFGHALNRYTSSLTPGNPDLVPFMIHPYVPPGMMIAITERLPFPNSNIGAVYEMAVLQPFTAEVFARTARQTPVGVSTQEALKCSFSGGIGVIYGLSNN